MTQLKMLKFGAGVVLLLALYGMAGINSARAVTIEALYQDCKKALLLSEGGFGTEKASPEDRAKHFMSFFKCGGYINGALEMKRALNAAAKSKEPYCSPKKAVLNLTVAVRLFVGFVEGGKKTHSKKPAAGELMHALTKVLDLNGDLAKKHGCFPDK